MSENFRESMVLSQETRMSTNGIEACSKSSRSLARPWNPGLTQR